MCKRSDFGRPAVVEIIMRLIDRYIFKEWLAAFLLVMSIVIGLLVLQAMYDSLPDLLAMGATSGQLLSYYALKLPTYLPAVLPIGLLVSLLFSLGSLHRKNEIVAMRASGLGLLGITRVLWVVGLLLSAAMLYLNASVIPRCVELSRTIVDNLGFAYQEQFVEEREVGVIEILGFHNRRDNRLWYMNRFSERAWLAMGITVHELTDDGKEKGRISAREAYFDDVNGHWVFIEGRELLFDPETGDPLRSLAFDKKVFEGFREDPNLMLALHERPEVLSLFELRRVINAIPPEENPVVNAYKVRYFSLLAAPFNCLVVVGIAVPFAVAGVRTNPMIGVSKSMGWFLVFYLLMSLGSILGERKLVPIWVAAWLPNMAMLLLSVWFFRKVR